MCFYSTGLSVAKLSNDRGAPDSAERLPDWQITQPVQSHRTLRCEAGRGQIHRFEFQQCYWEDHPGFFRDHRCRCH